MQNNKSTAERCVQTGRCVQISWRGLTTIVLRFLYSYTEHMKAHSETQCTYTCSCIRAQFGTRCRRLQTRWCCVLRVCLRCLLARSELFRCRLGVSWVAVDFVTVCLCMRTPFSPALPPRVGVHVYLPPHAATCTASQTGCVAGLLAAAVTLCLGACTST